ncbi:MAG: iron-sulfur cluster assembly scaffold protein [Kangiellaceae bacterium]|nr:iron-sulfur cluster assembly scaffold protein [Kangiellaceae bacterium]
MKKLYQSALKEHYTSPIGKDKHFAASHQSDGYNATCGDEISILLSIHRDSEIINNIGFVTDSCAICTASASILCKLTHGKPLKELRHYFQFLETHLNSREQVTQPQINIDELACLLPVSEHLSRINCALLPWQTALNAIDPSSNKGSEFPVHHSKIM